jgi:diketogulonate reductase-like aldo/keto reductase
LAALEADSPEELELALKVALDAGYRYFDTAVQYNNEHIIGKVLEKYFQSGSLKRSDVFITSKLPFYGHRPEDAARHIEQSLKRLRVNYIDLYLLHGPYPCKVDGKGDLLQDEDGKPIPDLIPHIDTWRVLEQFYRDGKIRAIGVSNFNQEQIHDLYNQSEIPPHNLQIECHILWPQEELFEFCKLLNITMTAYCPTGLCETLECEGSSQENVTFEHSFVLYLAKKYNKTPAQILLRYMIQRGISVIPRSTNPEKIYENIMIFDFKLSEEEMYQFGQIRERKRLFNLDFVEHHPWHPFRKDHQD